MENRAEDTALFHGLALPSAETACAFTGILLCLLSLVSPLTSAIRHQRPLLLASIQPPTSPTVVLFARVAFPVLDKGTLVRLKAPDFQLRHGRLGGRD